MSKLEKKLIELGYELDLVWCSYGRKCYRKKHSHHLLEIFISRTTNGIGTRKIFPLTYYDDQSQIDNLQQAFNQLQKDLKILEEEQKKC